MWCWVCRRTDFSDWGWREEEEEVRCGPVMAQESRLPGSLLREQAEEGGGREGGAEVEKERQREREREGEVGRERERGRVETY